MVDEQNERELQHEHRFAAIEQNVAVILSNYATREDIARLETQIVRMEISNAQMETQIARMESHLIKWMMGLMFGTVISIVSSVVSLARLFG